MPRVLVVDDECVTADTLGLIFSKKGFETRVAYSVNDALRHVTDSCPDLVLCDITMPDRDGLELMVEIGRQKLDCSVLVLTGYPTNLRPVHEQIRKMSQPADVLTKPCHPEDLLRAALRILAPAT